MVNGEPTALIVLLGMLAALIGGDAAARFVDALSKLRDGSAMGRAVILLWLARLGIPHRQLEDAAQDTLEAALRAWDRFNPEHPRGDSNKSRPIFKAWLNAICVNVASHYRDRAHMRREVLSADPIACHVPDATPLAPEGIAIEERRDELMVMLAALTRANPECAGVLVAHDLDGVPIVEIGETLGLPTSTVYKWRMRALAQLQALSRERDRDV